MWPGYVEAHIWAGYAYTAELIERANQLVSLVGIPAAIRDDFTGEWHRIPNPSILYQRV